MLDIDVGIRVVVGGAVVAAVFSPNKGGTTEWGSYFVCIELPLYSRICCRGLLA